MDCPGLCDTGKTEVEVCTIIIQAIGGMHPGPHAVLFTVKLGRFTEEEYTVFKRLKEILDENVLKYMIVVFTGGDALQDEEKNFADMLRKVPPNLDEVLNMVDNKCIVFNNKAKDPRPQVNKLFDMVRDVIQKNNGVAYSCPKYALISEKMEEEIAKRLKGLEVRDLEQQNYILELEAKAKAAEEHILRLQAEFTKKEFDLENKIRAEIETLQKTNNDFLRKLELESQKKKEEEKRKEEQVKRLLETKRKQQEMAIMALQNQHEAERQKLLKEKETLERQMRENEEIRRKQNEDISQKKKEEQVKLLETKRKQQEMTILALQNQHEAERQKLLKEKETLERQMRENEEISQKKREEEVKLLATKRKQQEMAILALQNQHKEERQKLLKEKETLERQMRENEEIKRKKMEEEEKRKAERQEVYEAVLRKMRDEIATKENKGFFSSLANALKKIKEFLRIGKK